MLTGVRSPRKGIGPEVFRYGHDGHGEAEGTAYADQGAAQQIRKASEDAKAAGRTDVEITTAMIRAIEDQIASGVYISRHLRAGAVDIQSVSMTGAEANAFRECVAGAEGVSLLEEATPPHFHLQFDFAEDPKPADISFQAESSGCTVGEPAKKGLRIEFTVTCPEK